MILNYIWIGFFLIALLVALIKTFNGDTEVFSAIVQSTFDMASTSFDISIGLTGVLCFWLGIMKIGENGGSVQFMAKIVGPFFNKLFPGVPENHPARGSMLMNFSANMLGLDNAATPLGLKAMNQLQELNDQKDRATNAMIMFLVLNTSGLTIIPVTVMTYRAQFDAANPADVFIPILVATYFASLVGLITVALYQKINLFDKVILAYLGGITGLIGFTIWYFSQLDADQMEIQSKLISGIILFGIICSFILMAIRKKVNVYESFVDGAKEGFSIAIKIIPFLVAILVAIGVFRASGAMDLMMDGVRFTFTLFMDETRFVDGLPTALMKPLSGSGARGMMLETYTTFGVDSFAGKLSSTLQGATDTTFYIIAVYFGAVGIKNTRYAIKAGLLADLAGIVAAIFVSYMFFGKDADDSFNKVEFSQEFAQVWMSPGTETNQIEPFLNESCVLYDQVFDTIATNDSLTAIHLIELRNQLSLKNVDIIHSNQEEGVFVKFIGFSEDSLETKESFALSLEERKISTIQYLGNF